MLLARCAEHLQLILYAGGDLPQALGDRVAAVIPLRCWWGASECGLPHQLIPPNLGPHDWRYIRFHPSVGAAFEKVTDNDYELIVRRDDSIQKTQACFSVRGQEDLDHYRTKDLFHAHATVPDAWCWRARADDIIVFLNGEKANPVPMEQYVVAHNPEVSGALVVGTSRFQAALLIELAASEGNKSLNTAQQAELIERIWPSIEDANRAALAHARVEKALILILPADRPLIRAGKGTIQRAASIAQYAAEIDALYDNADAVDGDRSNSVGGVGPFVDLSDPQSVSRFIRDSVGEIRGLVDPDTESTTFFERGLDSLMALQLLRTLRRGLRRPDLALSTIYANPTIPQLQEIILSGHEVDPSVQDASLMAPLLKTYSDLIRQIPKPANPVFQVVHQSENERATVVLTGSTGTVGTFLLRSLLDSPNIEHVVCLNRSPDGGRAVQEQRFAAAELETRDLYQRATFLQADLSRPLLGLGKKTYEDLSSRAGLIIHNAWSVNFNLGLAAFQSHLAGLVNLFRLAADSAPSHAVRVVFISSVSAIGGLASRHESQAEKIFNSFDTPSTNGYARSKFLSELLCNTAVESLGIPAVVVRLGQVAGAVRRSGGRWNENEWLPTLIISSRDLGCLPSNLGSHFSGIDWIPSDLLADVIVELVTSHASSALGQREATSLGARVFNIRNPCTTSWQSLLPAVLDAFKIHSGLKNAPIAIVSPATWLDRLREVERKAGDHGSTRSSSPAMKLVDFYSNDLWGSGSAEEPQWMEPMEIDRSLDQSATLRGMQAIQDEWIQKWVAEWLAPDAFRT